MSERFPHQEVRLIGMTQPVEGVFEDGTDAEDLISYCARVSNPSNQANFETSGKLLKYCIRKKHWSIFEMVNVVLEVKTTRDIGRQLLRHQYKFQEFCVDGDTLITTETQNSGSKKVKISDLYRRYMNPSAWQNSDNLVRVYDEASKTLIKAKIKEVFDTGVRGVYRMTLDNGKEIDCTEDHKLYTFGGYKRLKDIVPEKDFVACNGIPCYQDKEWLASAKQAALRTGGGLPMIAEMASVKYVTVRKWLRRHGLQFTKQEVASYTPAWNKGLVPEMQPGFNKVKTPETREKMRASSRKEKHSNLYKNGNYCNDGGSDLRWRNKVASFCKGYHLDILHKQEFKCAVSGVDIDMSNSEVDHIVPVYARPDLAFDPANLQVLSVTEHHKKSVTEMLAARQTIKYSMVRKIVYLGERQTYDMEIDHVDHNYIANGIVTHNSQRYASVDTDSFVIREPRFQDTKNRQNSITLSDMRDQPYISPEELAGAAGLYEEWKQRQEFILETVKNNYEWAIKHGLAKEQARSILPEGNTMSCMYVNGTLRNWMHYCWLRQEKGTQAEHQDIATKAWEILKDKFEFLNEIEPQEQH